VSDLRIAFFGSPEFALPSLTTINQRHNLVLVVSQPNKPAGRGLATHVPPVASWALRNGIPVVQPNNLKANPTFRDHLDQANIDIAVTVAYGKILPKPLLRIPAQGFLNAHASLLPKYRGAAPIQWALINGEAETGISIISTEVGLDTGPIRLSRKLTIGLDETATGLFDRLASLAATALAEALDQHSVGVLPSQPQDNGQATLAPLLTREDGKIDWTLPAREIYNRYRGVHAWPGSWCSFLDSTLKVEHMRCLNGHGPAGYVLAITQSGVVVGTASGTVCLERVKPVGKPTMSALDWRNGYGVRKGTVLA
jgi:methionyl-tRNA formyltransferase